ncbi:DUF881 domain-containing protein [Candidatus Peregrinibacteria bacterium]|jgi:uncharacterized protein YlxW (UPF0749 family)|nr:DUF881 domain-containing protein [Candidatus Peregrinibacteria bacterium]MBT7483970.1 DUF881 domain-containing protein [Candidatus Peregrinibacteria bacterium]MBT7703318.1 DUF881 domain-containing protein [Candidatus Peregrinibacteria bacterium]
MNRKITLIVVGGIVGLLIALQFRSYAGVEALLARDVSENDVLSTIYVLKMANQSLKQDISDLETQLSQYSDQTSAYETLVAEIEKNELLLGLKPIFGPGLEVIVNNELNVELMVDLTNEWWGAGAEAISVNDLRLTEIANSFTMLNDLLLLDGNILEVPYKFTIIGDSEVLENQLLQPGGTLDRLEAESTPITE